MVSIRSSARGSYHRGFGILFWVKLETIWGFLKRLYLFIHGRHWETAIDIEGEAGSLQGAWCRTRTQDPRIVTWAKGKRSTIEPPRCPLSFIFINLGPPTYLFCFGCPVLRKSSLMVARIFWYPSPSMSRMGRAAQTQVIHSIASQLWLTAAGVQAHTLYLCSLESGTR